MPYPLKWSTGIVISGSDWNDVRLYQPASYVVFREGSTYYAKGCYSGSTDTSGSNCHEVVQFCLNTLNDSGVGGKISFLAGNYAFTNGVIISGSVIVLEGESWSIDGSNGTCFTFTSTGDGSLIKYTSDHSTFIGSIKEITFFGNNSYGTTGNRHGVHFEKWISDVRIQNCFFRGWSGSAIRMEATGSGTEGSKIWNIWILDTLIEDNNYGIHMLNADHTVYRFIDRVTIRGGHWYNNINSLRIEDAWVNNVIVDGVTSELDRQHCIYLNGGRNMTITNCHLFDGSSDLKGRYDCIYLTGSATQTHGAIPNYIKIIGNTLGNIYKSGYYRYAVNLDGLVLNTRVENNVMEPYPITTSSFHWCGATGSYKIDGTDPELGKVNSLNFIIRNNVGYITEDWGITPSLADGGSIQHNLSSGATSIQVTQNAVTTTVTKFTASQSGSRGIYFYHDGSGTASFWWHAITDPIT